MSTMGHVPPTNMEPAFKSNRPSRPEMSGPSDIDGILSGLKTKTIKSKYFNNFMSPPKKRLNSLFAQFFSLRLF